MTCHSVIALIDQLLKICLINISRLNSENKSKEANMKMLLQAVIGVVLANTMVAHGMDHIRHQPDIIDKIAMALAVPENLISTLNQEIWKDHFEYSKNGLKMIWQLLKNSYGKKKLSKVLQIIRSCLYADQSYWVCERYAIAALVMAGANIETTDHSGHTCLGEAVLRQDIPATQLLLEHGADPNVPFGEFFPEPIVYYARTVPIPQLLLKYGAKISKISQRLLHRVVNYHD